MASGVVTEVLKLEAGSAIASAQSYAAAVKAASDAQREISRGAEEWLAHVRAEEEAQRAVAAAAESQAAALYRLETISASLKGPAEAAALAFQRQAAAIHQLGIESGNTAQAEEALHDLMIRHAGDMDAIARRSPAAVAAQKALADATRDAAEAQRIADEAARTAERTATAQAAALARLETISADLRGPTEASALAFQRQAAAIHQLGIESGNTAGAEEAIKNLIVQRTVAMDAAQAKTVSMASTHRTLAATTDQVTTSTNAARYGFINLGNQFADVGIQLQMGMSPLTILIQQGPQIVGAIAEIGGVSSVLSGLGGMLAGALPVLAAVGAAVAVGATGWTVYANIQADVEQRADAVNQRLIDAAEQLPKTGAEVDALAKRWAALADELDTARGKIAVINGEITKADNDRAQAIDKVRDANRAALLEEAHRVVVLRQAMIAAEELSRSETAGTDVQIKARQEFLALQPQVKAATAALEAHRAQVDEVANSEGDAAEYAATLAEANKTGAAASREATSASRDHAAALREEEAAFVRLVATAKTDFPAAMAAADAALIQSRGGPADASQRALAVSRSAELAKLGEQAAVASQARAAADAAALRSALLMAAANSNSADAVEREAHAAEAKARANAVAGQVADVAGTLSSSSSIISTVASSSPQAAAVVGVMRAITNLQETITGLKGFVFGFIQALGDVPSILIKELPSIVKTLIPEIAKLIPILIVELVAGLPVLITQILLALADPQTWIDAAKAFVQGMTEAAGGFLTPEGSDVSLSSKSTTIRSGQSVQLGTTGTATHTGGATPTVGARTSRNAGPTTVQMHYHGPVIGVGQDTSRDIAHELVRNAALFSPA